MRGGGGGGGGGGGLNILSTCSPQHNLKMMTIHAHSHIAVVPYSLNVTHACICQSDITHITLYTKPDVVKALKLLQEYRTRLGGYMDLQNTLSDAIAAAALNCSLLCWAGGEVACLSLGGQIHRLPPPPPPPQHTHTQTHMLPFCQNFLSRYRGECRISARRGWVSHDY